MKNFYYAVSTQEDGKNYAYVIKTSPSDNLLAVFTQHKGLTHINACHTKKQAEQLSDFWNECYKTNGTYMF